VTEAGIFCQKFASLVNFGLKVVGGGWIIPGDVTPDILQVGQSFLRQLLAFHLAAGDFDHFFLKAAIFVCTCSAEWVRPARTESMPALILLRTSLLQTSSR
jgi:hypothetical protein